MYHDEIFENALKESKVEDLAVLKEDVRTVENIIEKFLSQMLECTTTISERDFNMCGI